AGAGGMLVKTVISPDPADSGDRKPRDCSTVDNAVYVLHTSGSTGRPKRVIVSHRNLANYVSWAADYYRLSEGTGSVVHSPLSFDLTVTSLLAPLIVGQTVLLLPESTTIEDLAGFVAHAHDLTLLKLTPSHLAALNCILPEEVLAGCVRTIVIGG